MHIREVNVFYVVYTGSHIYKNWFPKALLLLLCKGDEYKDIVRAGLDALKSPLRVVFLQTSPKYGQLKSKEPLPVF